MGSMSSEGLNDPGTYVVKSGDEETEVDVDRLYYDVNDSLVGVKDGDIVATFRWWDSVVKKS